MVVVVVVPRRPLRPEGQIWAIERVPGRGGFVLCAFSDSDCPIQSDSNLLWRSRESEEEKEILEPWIKSKHTRARLAPSKSKSPIQTLRYVSKIQPRVCVAER